MTGSQTSKIKSHHNVGGLPKKMRLKLIEPLKFLFKDEVRKLGSELSLRHGLKESARHFGMILPKLMKRKEKILLMVL